MANLTTEEFRQALPPSIRRTVTQDVIDIVNSAIGEPEFIETFRENLIGYQSVLSQGRFKLHNYVEAVKYVSHKLLGKKNIQAYSHAFPEKIAEFKRRGVTDKDIATYASAFNKSKLVNLIMAQSMIPTHVLNADIYQEAINIQLELARTAQSEKVRCEAANSLMVQLKPPEIKKIELDIGFKEDSHIGALRETTMELVRQQKLALESGAISVTEAAHSGLILEMEKD